MQTLNVGAGRTDTEYKADNELRLEELRSDIKTDADLFLWAAGLAALGTGLFIVRFNLFVSIGLIDLLTFYGRSLGPIVPYAAAVLWVLAVLGLGYAARQGQRWAFWAGIALYAADMVALLVMFSIWSFGLHFVFVFKWFQGQRAVGELEEAERSQANAAHVS